MTLMADPVVPAMEQADPVQAAAAVAWRDQLEHCVAHQLDSASHRRGVAPERFRDSLEDSRHLLAALARNGYTVVTAAAVNVALVSTAELANQLGVDAATLLGLYRRGLLPPAVGEAAEGPVWRAELISDWVGSLKRRGEAIAATREAVDRARGRSAQP